LLITEQTLKELARDCGFELVGITQALPSEDFGRFEEWRYAGRAGEMAYMTDHRGDLRADPRNLVPDGQSIVCVGKLYRANRPQGTGPEQGRISCYASGEDYHDVMRRGLENLISAIRERHPEPFSYKICVDTAPLLERSYARAAGLGWIGKNTCLINQEKGSWFFLGELLLSIPLASDRPAPFRCGTCTRCIDACPTQALVSAEQGHWTLDSRLCISYLTIEKRGEIDADLAQQIGNHIFGCDICQEVCPWNRHTEMAETSPYETNLECLAELTEEEFRARFRHSPVWRARYHGFLRNIAIAMGNSGDTNMQAPLRKLASHADPVIARTASVALSHLAARLLVLAVVLFASLRSLRSEPLHVEDPLKNPGFVHFYNLEFDQALEVFDRELTDNPNDPAAYNHVAQTILYREMYRDGALESQLVSGTNPFLRRPKMEISAEDKNRFNEVTNQSIRLCEQRLHKDAHDIDALYAFSVVHGLRANYLFLVEKQWMAALHESIAGRRANDEILKLEPDLVDAHLVSGISHYIVAGLPFYLRMLGSVNGFHGNRQEGLRELQMVAQSGVLNRYDAQILLAVIYRRERRPKLAIPLVQDLAATFPGNTLFRFEEVQMYSDLGEKNSALQVLAEIEQLRNNGAPGYAHLPEEKIQYSKANLLFWYGDLAPALAGLKQVTRNADQLDLSTALMAWLRLGQLYDLQGKRGQAIEAYRETMRTAPDSEPAFEAKGYISTPYHRKRSPG
jgi:epoxyqueuosine reductase